LKNNDTIYRKLQKHLNRQAVGFPPSASGADIRLLKHIFTPEEAAIACAMSYSPETVEDIFKRVSDFIASPDELKAMLDTMQIKGGIESRKIDRGRAYCNAPLVVGMYELQLYRMTPEFVKDFNDYTGEKRFGIEFISTELPQMRTIPVEKSLTSEHRTSTFDEVRDLIIHSTGPFVINPCICRTKKEMEGKKCRVTERTETCLAMGSMAEMLIFSNQGREVSLEEALDIIRQNQEEGLVLQPANSREADFICSCCGCCCGILRINQRLPAPMKFWASNFYARVSEDSCTGCGLCAERCQVMALRIQAGRAVIDLNRCIGCGLCVTACDAGAISLKLKEKIVEPPETREKLYDILYSRKKGPLKKLKLIAEFVMDSIRN